MMYIDENPTKCEFSHTSEESGPEDGCKVDPQKVEAIGNIHDRQTTKPLVRRLLLGKVKYFRSMMRLNSHHTEKRFRLAGEHYRAVKAIKDAFMEATALSYPT